MILWKNGFLHSLENKHKVYRSMATDQGLIVGFDDEIEGLFFDHEIDLKNNHLYPGFVDSHLHLIGYGEKLESASLKNHFEKTSILKEIKNKVELGITFFEGYTPSFLTKNDLNKIKSNGPLILRHSDYHSVTVNDFVLTNLNLKSDSGELTENESALVIKAHLIRSNEDLKKSLKKAIKSLYKFGVTGGHSDDLFYYHGFEDTLNVFKDTLKSHPFRTHLLMHHEIVDDFVKANLTFLNQDQYLQLGAVKIFYDGTLTSKTALLKYPYLNEENHGVRIFEAKMFLKTVKKIRNLNLPLAIHVIGDLGLKEVVHILKKYPPKSGLHDRIIHASLAEQNTVEMMRNLPLVLDIQPQFISSDLPHILNIFSKQPEFIYPFKTYLKNKLTLCGSSDAPVETPNPLLGMHAAIYRKLNNQNIFKEEEQLTPFEALKLYTTFANIPTYQTNRGLLKKGYIADFTVLSKNVLTMDEHSFFQDLVELTVINEKIVYQHL